MKKIVATLMSLLFVVMMIPNISFAAQKRIYGEVKNNIMRIYYDDLQSTRTGQIHTLGYYDEGYLSSITTVVFNDSVKDYRPKDTDVWFGRMNNLTHIYNLTYLDTSNVTSMSCMFYGCSSLNELDLSSFDTSNVTNIYGMFYGCSSLSELDLSSFNTLNVTNMNGMFYGCSSLNELDLSSFNTLNVTNMSYMFYGCSSLNELDLSSFDTSNVKDMSNMFTGCSSLNELDLSSFNTLNVTNMNGMFYGCSSLSELDLSIFNTNKVTGANSMFGNSTKLSKIYVNNNWNMSAATCSDMFDNCISLIGGNGTKYDSSHVNGSYAVIDTGAAKGYLSYKEISTPYAVFNGDSLTFYYDDYRFDRTGIIYDLSILGEVMPWKDDSMTTVVFDESFKEYKPTSTSKWFFKLTSLKKILNLSYLDTSNVTNMSDMFYGCSSLNELDLSSFDTSNVTRIYGMFYGCSSLSELDLSSFDTSNVPDMRYMFYGCSSLNELDLSSFNTSNVTNMRYMFSDCSSLSELDLSSFDTSNVTNMSDMFYGCSSLNELDLSTFNTNNVTNVDFMFANSTKLSKIYVNNNCNMSEATCWHTFNNCISLIGGNGTKYDSSHVNGSYAVIDTSDYPGYFTMKKCEVTFSSGSGATGTAPEAQSYEAYSEILLPENTFTYTGYKFAGWSDGNNTYQPIDKYSLNNKDVTFTAVWQANPTPTAQPTPVPTVVVTTTPTPSPVVPTTTVSPTSVPTVAPSTPAPTVAPELNVGDFVNRCYSVALGRDADSEGYKYWVDNLNNGAACGAQVGYGFIFSAEYINKNRSNEDFVKDLYSMYFDREPDEGGYNYWMDMLEDGVSRETVFAGFANSLEFYNLCTKYGVTQGLYLEGVDNTQQGGINCFVARLYKVCFNRLPDMAGQNGWVLKLYNGEVTGTSCSYGFVFSPEFIGKNPSNEEFVNYMYQAFFGREADEAGFNAWVKVLNDGGSYEDVFNGFTGSAEFFNLCASYQIIP